jgi:hypothetical protein
MGRWQWPRSIKNLLAMFKLLNYFVDIEFVQVGVKLNLDFLEMRLLVYFKAHVFTVVCHHQCDSNILWPEFGQIFSIVELTGLTVTDLTKPKTWFRAVNNVSMEKEPKQSKNLIHGLTD